MGGGWIERRKFIISRIKATLSTAKEKGLVIDEDKLVNEICLEYGCSRRTALEYIKSAKIKRTRYLK